jgi:hypothetical protein
MIEPMKTCLKLLRLDQKGSFTLFLWLALWGCLLSAQAAPAQSQWWKGNLHTHSFWSDGDDFPEMIVAWYKEHGYQFLALSDHNKMLVGDKWVNISTNNTTQAALERYVKKFGASWVELRDENGYQRARLKTLDEFRGRFEVQDKFLLVSGEEISDHFNAAPIHLNATNLRELIEPQGGKSAYEVMQNNINAVLEQRKKTGQPMIPHINHPNFVWALTAEDIMRLQGERFLEIYNGHPITKNIGDANHTSTERIWDIVLTRRLAEFGMDPIWGTAVDDSHNYHKFKTALSNPGRGWLMVRAPKLSPEALIAAMEKGDFYATSGVRLKEIKRSSDRLCIEIEPEAGITYTTQFIGTRKGYDASSEPVLVEGQPIPTTRRYSKDVGAILAEVKGTSPCYELKGDEIYVRAKIISSKPKENPTVEGDSESAWVQPTLTGIK